MKKAFLSVPSFLTAGLGLCPACLPLYAGLLSVVGISVADYAMYIPLIIAVMLVISLISLFWHAQQRRGYKPFILGLIASIIILVSKFYLFDNIVFYSGIGMLISASIWNIWPKKGTCSACVSQKGK